MKKDKDKPDPKPTDPVAEVVALEPNGVEERRTYIKPLIELEVGTKLFRYSAKVQHTYPDKPIDMILHCPRCHTQHVDAPDEPDAYCYTEASGSCSSTDPRWPPPSPRWDNPPHRSHLCHNCGMIWRPADVCTNGVAKLNTKGEKDTLVLRRRGKA